MRVTANRISRETPDVEFAPSRRSVARATYHEDICGRCGGFLVDDYCMDLDLGAGRGGDRVWAKRCVQCGDMIDETILRYRQSRSFPFHGSRHSFECERNAA